MTVSVLSSLLVVAASIGVVALLICLLPVPPLARTGMCVVAVLAGLAWGSDQVRLAFPAGAPQVAMTRLSTGVSPSIAPSMAPLRLL